MKPPWLKVATELIGQKEVKGKLHNPIILRMWDRIRVGVTDDETPWCAAGVGYCLEESGIRSTRSGWALSYEKYGEACDPSLGAIAYMKRYNSAGKLIGGHVAFAVGQSQDGSIMLLGFNQSDSVSVARFPKSRILGYRWPPSDARREPLPSYVGGGMKFSTNEA